MSVDAVNLAVDAVKQAFQHKRLWRKATPYKEGERIPQKKLGARKCSSQKFIVRSPSEWRRYFPFGDI